MNYFPKLITFSTTLTFHTERAVLQQLKIPTYKTYYNDRQGNVVKFLLEKDFNNYSVVQIVAVHLVLNPLLVVALVD